MRLTDSELTFHYVLREYKISVMINWEVNGKGTNPKYYVKG